MPTLNNIEEYVQHVRSEGGSWSTYARRTSPASLSDTRWPSLPLPHAACLSRLHVRRFVEDIVGRNGRRLREDAQPLRRRGPPLSCDNDRRHG